MPLVYATALLKKNNYNIKAIDAIAENISYPEFFNRIKKFDPDLLFIELATPSLNHDLELIRQIKSFSILYFLILLCQNLNDRRFFVIIY